MGHGDSMIDTILSLSQGTVIYAESMHVEATMRIQDES